MTVCDKIAALFEEDKAKGLSVRAVCKKARIPIASYYNYVQGDTKPDYETIRRISTAYNKPMSYFLEDWSPDKLNIEEKSPGFGINSEEQKLLDVFRGSKTAKLGIMQLLEMSEDERLDWIIQRQDKLRKGDK